MFSSSKKIDPVQSLQVKAVKALDKSLSERIATQDHRQKIYHQEIEQLKLRKEELKYKLHLANNSKNQYLMNCTDILQNKSRLTSIHGSNLNAQNSSTRILNFTDSESQPKYNKLDELKKQVNLLESSIIHKQIKNTKKIPKDNIIDSLTLKIKQQQDSILKELQSLKQMMTKHKMMIFYDTEVQSMQQNIFKNKQGLKKNKQDFINRNKQTIKLGYTHKMLALIQNGNK